MKQVLALQNCWDDPPGYLGEIMQAHNISFEVVDAEHAPLPANPGTYQALIILGGPQHLGDDEEKHPYLVEEKALIRKAVEQDIPCLGICLGGQLLANALGANVGRHHTPEIGFYEIPLTEEGKKDPLFEGLPGYQQAYHWHMDAFEIPGKAIRLASNENTLNQAFRYGKHAYGLQFHIELTPRLLDIWIHTPEYKEEIVSILGPGAIERLENERASRYPIYRQHTRLMFENFLKISKVLPR